MNQDKSAKGFKRFNFLASSVFAGLASSSLMADNPKPETKPVTKAFISGDEPGFVNLTEKDFVNVNCFEDTFKWEGNVIHCTGKPIGVIRSKEVFTNFELVCQWKHLKYAGNSGVFIWAPLDFLDDMKKNGKPRLPKGIECQVLDLGYEERWFKKHKKKSNWFTSHGDVFPCHAKMKPFAPIAPNKERSFPSKRLTLPANHWNHYYIRAINGEVRLWVNGEEVSGGTECDPKTGHLCLESEGSPIQFRNLKVRRLP